MRLPAGTKIGPYEIVALLGAGGMGEVYRARDMKLDREIAIKILPDALARDSERLARFEREAKVLAALNHPNIAHIYGVQDGALVMELAEGESPNGPMPFEDAWKIMMQVADALEYAHEKGIVHRDLKPANVKVNPAGVVKLLDFGLAKAFSPDPLSAPSNVENSPTLTINATEAGVILGTAAYMAPEQAKGKVVDKRADIWSWGVMLYELLTGDRLFNGADTADTLAKVLTKEPDLSGVPQKAHRLLTLCLAKDSKQRLRDIGDAPALLEPGRAPEAKPHKSASRYMVAAAGLIALIVSSILYVRMPAALRPMLRFTDDLGLDGPPTDIALSPDGTRLAFVSPDHHLYVRFLDNPKSTLLVGPEAVAWPFFSPDGNWIGYSSAAGKLSKIAVQGGAPVALCDAALEMGASWTADGQIVFSPSNRGGLVRVSDSGGNLAPVTQLDAKSNEFTHRFGQVLPGEKAVLFTTGTPGNYEDSDIVAEVLKTGQRKVLYHGGYHGKYLPSGHLVYMHAGTLFAAAMDLKRLELTGPSVPILDDVTTQSSTADARFDVSLSGTLAYIPETGSRMVYLAWLDASGKVERMNAPPKQYFAPPAPSPDGNTLAVAIQEGASRNLWLYDWKHDRLFPITFAKTITTFGAWAPDGKHLVFFSAGAGLSGPGMYWIRSDGAGQPQRLVEAPGVVPSSPISFSPDGKRLAFATGPRSIATLALDLSDSDRPGTGRPEPLLTTPAYVTGSIFSPDGRWLAYASDESGRREVYVTQFPLPRGKWLVSNGGGAFPMWSRDGRELYYHKADGQIMVVNYAESPGSFEPGPARVWSDRTLGRASSGGRAPDGRMAILIPVEQGRKPQSHVVFLLNFFDELKRRAPVG